MKLHISNTRFSISSLIDLTWDILYKNTTIDARIIVHYSTFQSQYVHLYKIKKYSKIYRLGDWMYTGPAKIIKYKNLLDEVD